MLKVKDSEISVEKYLTRAERAKRDAQLAEEAARKAAMAKDNGESSRASGSPWQERSRPRAAPL